MELEDGIQVPRPPIAGPATLFGGNRGRWEEPQPWAWNSGLAQVTPPPVVRPGQGGRGDSGASVFLGSGSGSPRPAPGSRGRPESFPPSWLVSLPGPGLPLPLWGLQGFPFEGKL